MDLLEIESEFAKQRMGQKGVVNGEVASFDASFGKTSGKVAQK